MLKNNKGITLIALIITIIVMMILVAVSVTIALDGGLFNIAKYAGSQTQLKAEEEMLLSAVVGSINEKAEVDFGKLDKNLPTGFTGEKGTYTGPKGNTFVVETNGKITSSSGTVKPDQPLGPSPVWSVAKTKPSGWSENVTAMTDGKNTIPLPNGFEISTESKEDSIDEGLVIKDRTNEFVWIPVENAELYEEDTIGPLTDKEEESGYILDTQEELDHYYGKDYYDYDDFTYAIDKTKIEENIQTYEGFYVGRYETIIDGTTIGVRKGKTILTTETLLKQGENIVSGDEYHYRWWGLYKAQKDMYANNSSVGSSMITSKQWDEIMAYTKYGDAMRTINTYADWAPELSGSAYADDSTKYDVSKNIYDLAGNVIEYTLTHSIDPHSNCSRLARGGGFADLFQTAKTSQSGLKPAISVGSNIGSRVTLYIK